MAEHYILTGAPGSGKTTIIEMLRQKGHVIVPESATYIIEKKQRQGVEKPWENKNFVTELFSLQKQRYAEITDLYPKETIFFDRSPLCTLALCKFLGQKEGGDFLKEIVQIMRSDMYSKNIFYIESLTGIVNTPVRQISYEDAQLFGSTHKEVYESYGFNLINIPQDTPQKRLEYILNFIITAKS